MSKTTSESQSSSSFKNDSLSSPSANQRILIFNWMSHLFIDEDVGNEDCSNRKNDVRILIRERNSP